MLIRHGRLAFEKFVAESAAETYTLFDNCVKTRTYSAARVLDKHNQLGSDFELRGPVPNSLA